MFHTTPHNTVQNMAQPVASFRTTTPSTAMTRTTTTKQVNPVHVHQDISRKAPLGHCAHVHKMTVQVCKPGESLTLRKVKHPHNGRTSMNRLPLTNHDILSQYSSCFEGIGHFPGDPYKFHLKPEHKPAQHAPRKVPTHLEYALNEVIESLVKLGILEEVKEHTDWVNLYVIVEKDTGSHHSPNHTIKKKLKICLDPRNLNEALEREPCHTRSLDEITAKLPRYDSFHHSRLQERLLDGSNSSRFQKHDRNFLAFMEKCMSSNLTLNSEKIQFKQSQVSFYGHCWSKHGIAPDPKKIQALTHMEFPPD